MTEKLKRAELSRLAKLFRQFASQTTIPEFRAKFLKSAEEFERALSAAPDGEDDGEPRQD